MKRRGVWFEIVALNVAALCLVACDDEDSPAQPRPSHVRERAEEPAEYEVIEFENGGSIAGSVRWSGPRPTLEPLEVRTDRAVCGESQPSPALRLSERGGVAGAVVSVMSIRRGRAPQEPEQPLAMTFRGCRFRPHVAAVGVGRTVRFENRDPVIHNVHGLRDGETVVDFGLPEEGAHHEWEPDEPGAVRLVCDAGHGWELAWLHVFEHPYYAVTDDDGDFRISDVPPGRYVLRVWHEGWRVVGTRAGRPRYSNPVVLTRTTSVSSRQETTLDFQLSQQAAEIAGGD